MFNYIHNNNDFKRQKKIPPGSYNEIIIDQSMCRRDSYFSHTK